MTHENSVQLSVSTGKESSGPSHTHLLTYGYGCSHTIREQWSGHNRAQRAGHPQTLPSWPLTNLAQRWPMAHVPPCALSPLTALRLGSFLKTSPEVPLDATSHCPHSTMYRSPHRRHHTTLPSNIHLSSWPA